jgi:hypothetical protein
LPGTANPEIVRDYIAGMTDRYFLHQFPEHLRPSAQLLKRTHALMKKDPAAGRDSPASYRERTYRRRICCNGLRARFRWSARRRT